MRNSLLRRFTLAAAGAAAALALFPASAQSQNSTVDTIKKRGQLVCGVSQGSAGLSLADNQGRWSGLDVDFCKALGRRQVVALQLFTQQLTNRAPGTGNRDDPGGVDARGGQDSNQCTFAVTEQKYFAKTRVGLELVAPGDGVVDVLIDAQLALIRRGRQALRNAAFVETHAGNVVLRQTPGEFFQTVVAPAIHVLLVSSALMFAVSLNPISDSTPF